MMNLELHKMFLSKLFITFIFLFQNIMGGQTYLRHHMMSQRIILKGFKSCSLMTTNLLLRSISTPAPLHLCFTGNKDLVCRKTPATPRTLTKSLPLSWNLLRGND